MRILHLINHCGKANGHVNVSVDMACTQAKNGHDVGYACSTGDYITLLESYNVQVFYVNEPHRSIKNLFSATHSLWKAIRKFRPDIIHVHMAAQVVIVQPFRLLGYKTVTTVHNEFDRSVWLMGLASRIVAVSKAGAEAMQRRGFSKKKVRVVLNGAVGSPRLSPSFDEALLGHPAIITVCGLHHRKGVADLINAFKIISEAWPAAHLYILGEGPSQVEYEELAKQLQISEVVHFMGYQNDPRKYLFPADIFVLASHSDPGPLVIAEARNAGCAIIATNVDGIPEMLDHGGAGILVDPRRPDLLAEAINGLLADRNKLTAFSNLAKANVERFTIGRVCSDMDNIYKELV